MPVRQVAPESKRERRRFVALEQELFGSEPLFVPEIESDVDKRLAGRSPFYEEIEHTLFLAGDGRDLARCAAFLNRRWQRDKGEDAGFIGYFAAAPEAATGEVGEMLAAAEGWLAERGARRVIAPFNGATFHGMSTQTDAFDEEPVFPFPWQPPHYPALLEAAGYRPTYPFWIFEIDLGSERYRATSRRALADARCEVRPLDKKRWDAEVEALRSIFNETFRDEWEFHAMTSAEFREFFDQLKPVLDRRQFLFAEVDGEVAGFCFGLPDWTPMFRSFGGRMGPLQIVRFMLRARRFDRAGLISIGVRDSQRGKHIGHTLAATLYRRYEELGLARAFYYPVNDANLASRRFAESFGGRGRILYTAYDKPLG
ncbi:MAG: GNAT family N-acetyltransferase [Solirubrobacterales bacterium]